MTDDPQRCATHRRYLFLKYRRDALDNEPNYVVWDAKRRTVAGTDLPTTQPARAALIAAGYLVTEEVTGATAKELTESGLTATEAAAVVAAME